MNTPLKAAVVGAGGISCHLVPMLSRLMKLVIIDADNYEPANSTRQFPALKSTGNKAQVLAEMFRPHTLFEIQAIPKYLKGIRIVNEEEFDGCDFIFGAVDNNQSRHIMMQLSEDLGIPAILAGNSHEHGEAHMLIPGTYDPRDHFEFPDTYPTPWSCNSDQTLEEFPQTAVANMLAAGCAIHLLTSWLRVENPNNSLVYSRNDALCGYFKRVKDFAEKKFPLPLGKPGMQNAAVAPLAGGAD